MKYAQSLVLTGRPLLQDGAKEGSARDIEAPLERHVEVDGLTAVGLGQHALGPDSVETSASPSHKLARAIAGGPGGPVARPATMTSPARLGCRGADRRYHNAGDAHVVSG
jgi:hypothetical protein